MVFFYLSVFALLVIARPSFVSSRALGHFSYSLSPSLISKQEPAIPTGVQRNPTLVQLNNLENVFLEGIADRICSLLEQNGFDLANFQNPKYLQNFLQDVEASDSDEADEQGEGELVEPEPVIADAPAKGGFFSGMKNFFKKSRDHANNLFHKNKGQVYQIAKYNILGFIRTFLIEELRRNLPAIELMNQAALGTLPSNVRIAISPTIYSIWKHIFEKYDVTPPEGFNLEDFITKGMSPEEVKAAKLAIKEAEAFNKLHYKNEVTEEAEA